LGRHSVLGRGVSFEPTIAPHTKNEYLSFSPLFHVRAFHTVQRYLRNYNLQQRYKDRNLQSISQP
jgi:hypothetical protein